MTGLPPITLKETFGAKLRRLAAVASNGNNRADALHLMPPPAWASGQTILKGNVRSSNGSWYQAITAGTTAGGGATFTGVLLPIAGTLSVAGTPVGTLGYTQPYAKNYSNETANGYNGNFFLGYGTPNIAFAGNESVFLGSYAGLALVGAVSGNSTAVGEDACGGKQGVYTTTGGANTCVGNDSGRNIQGTSGVNTLVGEDTGRNINSSFNVSLGSNSLSGNAGVDYAGGVTMTGGSNTAIGTNVMEVETTGNFNAAVGAYSMQANTTGSSNAALGANALESNTTGSTNVALGVNSLINLTTGAGNVVVGWGSGGGLTTGSGNTIIGNGLSGFASGLNNSVTIGYGAGSVAADFSVTSANQWTFYGGVSCPSGISATTYRSVGGLTTHC